MNVTIRQTTEADLDKILRVQSEAFGYVKEAELTQSLLNDPSAEPRVSLMAYRDNEAVGHILFTACHIADTSLRISLLAPLAVVPCAQKKGVGGKLIEAGLSHLSQAGVDLAFVLGHPEYYPRYGFIPAHTFGLQAPYPIPEQFADAWMVQALSSFKLGSVHGTVVCADALNQPEHWRE